MWPIFISLRYLTARRKERFISIISVISVLGIAVGVAALIVVISIMTGFDEEIKDKIIGTYAHLIVLGGSEMTDPEPVIAEIKQNNDVVAASAFIEKQAILKSEKKVSGVIIRGIDIKNENQTTNIKYFTSRKSLDIAPGEIIAGAELMKIFDLDIGSTVSIFSPQSGKTIEYKIADIFTSGRYDYDANIICMGLDDAREIFKSGAVTGIGVKVKDEYKVSSVKSALEDTLGFSFSVRSWMELDKNLMKALAMEKRMMFIVLGLIVLVACFNICASLIMMVMEKTKDIGILKAIGANSGGIGAVFLCVGFATGFTGSLVGGASGFFIAKYINQIAGFVEDIAGIEFFPSDIYYFSEIPSKIVMNDVFGIMAFSLALALISGIYPAIQASRLDPIDAIRYE